MKRPKPKRSALTPKERADILARQGGCCVVWGCTATRGLEGEHSTPVSLGGNAKPDQLMCKRHHKMKTYGSPGRVGGDIRDIKHIRKIEEKRTQADKRAERGSRMQSRGFDKSLTKKLGTGEVVRRDR